jgi:polyphosphate kinase
MKERFLSMIHRERENHLAGRPAQILAKMNQIEDREIVRALYHASQAGVPIDLIVRGFCTLRPGLPELSPTIRVISVVGRFLEHSRIFYFRNAAEDPLRVSSSSARPTGCIAIWKAAWRLSRRSSVARPASDVGKSCR